MQKYLLFFFLLSLFFLKTTAQKISGTVFNGQGNLLPYSSITIKGTSTGVSANSKAKFSLNVKPGTYTIICQHIGYARQEKQVVIANNDEQVSFILNEQELSLNEVIVKKGGEDPAYGIIRQAIKKKKLLQ
ncbi:MAG: carboxypeptidase-like regulatory domain-containing protein [Chitinophagaceae bacterium]|nr:carboxypeptidase-like regulatory domain-containing protein [Chitinophagaceae bacterium]